MSDSLIQGKKLLLVDDEKDLLEALVFEFSNRGCEIFQAANGQEALDILKEQSIDIVLSDIHMPYVDGVQLLQAIREKNQQRPAVILATGYANYNDSDVKRMGGYGLLAKPLNRKLMLSMIEEACKDL